MIIPKEKDQEIDTAQKQIKEVEKQYRKGVITPGERYNKIVDIWTHCTDQIANVMLRTLDNNQGKKNTTLSRSWWDSGARGNRHSPSARRCAWIDGQALRRHHRETDSLQLPGRLTVLEYFNFDSRRAKGLADTALKTADSGYNDRKWSMSPRTLSSAKTIAHNQRIWVQAIYEGEDEVVKLSERLMAVILATTFATRRNPKESLVRRQRRS